jgi:acetyl esterase/lipase
MKIGDRDTPGTRISAQTPVPARLKLIHTGAVIHEATAARLDFTPKEPGPYRLEAWLEIDGEQRPWIYSNAVYLETPAGSQLRMPSSEIAATVEVHRDIAYAEGKPEDAAKHKLDVYTPKGKTGFPVLFFVHGGAWRSGDRARYTALGNRFARDGIGVVIPSYRLSPANLHPAHIEDVAAAFAWTLGHIAGYGGDVSRIYAGGHSAGGHLTALLALDPRHLGRHGLSPRSIKGVIPMSGVYNVELLANVFGADSQARREASPLHHVQAPAPPFLITYCQWDYPLLPAQARAFHAALRQAGVASELVYIPGENHISEIVNAAKDNDPTARAILGFIR